MTSLSAHIARPEPVPQYQIKIYPTLPINNKDTFDNSLQITPSDPNPMAAVLYAPDLQNIGCLDNTDSNVESSWGKTVTTGFSLSTTVTFSIGFQAEVNFIVEKDQIQLGMSISFTAQYNKSISETMTFTVPAGKKGFLYQGYLYTQLLQHNTTPRTYDWVPNSQSVFLSNVLYTSQNPVTGAATLANT